MMGRLCISGIISEFNHAQKQLIKEAISFYKRNRELIKNPLVYYHTAPRNIQDRDNLKIMEYLNGDTSMVYISGHSFSGECTFQPKIGTFEVTDIYPNGSGITVTGDSISVKIQNDQVFGRILILKKK